MEEKTSTTQIIKMMEGWFKQLPPLPANAVETIFKITPILALVFGILGLLTGISALGILSILSPLAVIGGATHVYGLGIIATIGLIASSIMMLVAYPGLRAGKTGAGTCFFGAR